MNIPLKSGLLITATFMAVIMVIQVFAYPLDGADESGIRRLHAYVAQQASPGGPKLAMGALLGSRDIRLGLTDSSFKQEYDSIPMHPQLKTALESIFKSRDPSYGVVVIDISDPEQPVWAGVRPDIRDNVGSVGKILVLSGVFNALAKSFPDIESRKQILSQTSVTGRDWVNPNEHKVPHYQVAENRNRFAIVAPTDQFKLSEWIDHMISASSNAAASVVWREAMLIYHMGDTYPVADSSAENFFNSTPGANLLQLSQMVINEPLQAVGIEARNMQQGSFWTGNSKRRVPGIQSYASPRELARYLVKLEQGLLVDSWSSLEMKKYFYMTSRRYRYAYAPELHDSAVYFKSGSLYSCVAEEGFRCAKYAGNRRNSMNSVAIVESLPGAEKPYRYIVALMSNVLKVNSAWDHSRLAAAIHTAILTRAPTSVNEEGDMKQIIDSGIGEG